MSARDAEPRGFDLSLVVALARRSVIGCNGALPWHLSSDLKRFRKLTTGNVLLMGRKTFESIGAPLPNRHSIVLSLTKSEESLRLTGGSFNRDCEAEDENQSVTFATSLMQAFAIAEERMGFLRSRNRAVSNELFVIGGGIVFEETIGQADRLYVTTVDARVIGDAKFPEFSLDDWKVVKEDPWMQDTRDQYQHRFTIYERIRHLMPTE